MFLRNWLERIPITDPIQRRQAYFFQLLLLGWFTLASIGFPLNIFRGMGVDPQAQPAPPPEALPPIFLVLGLTLFLATFMVWFSPLIALALLRYGRFWGALHTAIWGLLIGHGVATFALGLTEPSVFMVYQIPIALAALLSGRRLLMIVAGYSITFVLVVGLLQMQQPPLAGFFSSLASDTIDLTLSLGFFIATTLLISVLLDQFGNILRTALADSLLREAELVQIRDSLEHSAAAHEGTERGARGNAPAHRGATATA
jgi:hypothetical protein